MLSVPLPTTKASPNPSRVAMIPTLTPAPNYPIPLVHFLENINYPLRCTKLWFFLTRLWVPADRVFVPVEPRGGLPGSGPPEVPKHGLRGSRGGREDVAGAPQGLSLSRWESVISPGSSLLAGRGRGGRRPCAWGYRRALRALPSAGIATRPSGHQPPPRGREQCGRSPPRPQVGEEGARAWGDGRPRKPAWAGGLAPRNPHHGSRPAALLGSFDRPCDACSGPPPQRCSSPPWPKSSSPLLFLNTWSPPQQALFPSQYPFPPPPFWYLLQTERCLCPSPGSSRPGIATHTAFSSRALNPHFFQGLQGHLPRRSALLSVGLIHQMGAIPFRWVSGNDQLLTP